MTEKSTKLLIHRASIILRALSLGIKIEVAKYPYPLAMGENYGVGFWYNDNVLDNITIKDLICIAKEMSDQEFAVLVANVALNEIKQGDDW